MMRNVPDVLVPDRAEVLLLPGVTIKEVLVMPARGRVGSHQRPITVYTPL